jgi:hypothetical protein
MVKDLIRLTSLLFLLGATGCFNVQMVDPGPLVIDDFDDGDTFPADPTFDAWSCYAVMASEQPTCMITSPGTGYGGTGRALELQAAITDPMNGLQDHGGAALQTRASTTVDFSHFNALTFDYSIDSGTLPIGALLYAELGCSTVLASDGSNPKTLYILHSVPTTTRGWNQATLSLNEFGPPQWVPLGIKGGAPACLSAVDSIRFSIDADLIDGGSASFTLTIDNVELQ